MGDTTKTGTEGSTDQGGKAADAGTDQKAAGTNGADNASADGSKDSGKATADLEAANAAQKKVNQDLEAKLNQLRDGLKAALGIQESGTKDGDTDKLVSALQEQLDSLTHKNLVSEVALAHGITDADDRALLAGIKDRDAMEKLAARLAPEGGDAAGNKKTSGKPGTPKADPSQGRGNGEAGARPSSIAQVIADRQAARQKK